MEEAVVSGKTAECMAVSVMCQARRCNKSDEANCRLASPHCEKLPRPSEKPFSLLFSSPSQLLSLIFKGLRETFGWHAERKAVKVMLTWMLNAVWYNTHKPGFSQEWFLRRLMRGMMQQLTGERAGICKCNENAKPILSKKLAI